ncbi:MAG TPA: cysteine peptidase family C39 domain-containing protein [Bdellovibrionota bacterium]|jgi:predicted double-glycine peptidase
MIQRIALVLFVLVLPLIALRAETQLGNHPPALPANHLAVPVVSQATNYTCGAAALLSVLYYWHVTDENESTLAKALEADPENGTTPEKIQEVAKTFGLQAEIREGLNLGDLEAALKKGETVIVEAQAWRSEGQPELPWSEVWEDGHYLVLIGMDAHYVYFMDPSAHTGYGYIPRDEFMDRWHDYDVYDGNPVRHYQLAIFLKGGRSLNRFPDQLVRVE